MSRPAGHGIRARLIVLSGLSAFSLARALLSPALAALLLAGQLLTGAFPARAQSLPELSTPPATPQITERIDENRLTTLPGNTSRLAQAAFDAGPVPDSTPLNHILIMLRRSGPRDQALAQLMHDQYDPRSPNFHKWLTPEQFGDLYGPSPEDVEQVADWLRQHGFTINQIAPGRTFIDFSGTAGRLKAALHTEIHSYRVRGEEHFANASDPMIPSALALVVSGFRALNDFHPKPLARDLGVVRRDRTTGKWIRLAPGHLTTGSGANATYLVGPQDFAQIYGVNQVWQQTLTTPSGQENLVGTGQTIGVAGDTLLASTDIATFRDEFGITALGPHGSVFVDIPPASVCPAPDPAVNDPEGYLDAEWSGAMAPDATIDFVACGDQGVTSGADLASAYIVEDPAHAQQIGVLSSSYGYCEENPISETSQFYVTLWQQAAAEGITVVVATGDSGSAECDEFTGVPYAVAGQGVNAEASTPYNIAAGGTDFSDVFSGTTANYWSAANSATLASAKSYIPEMTWNDTCASPLVLATFGQGFSSSGGPSGFCTWASQQPIDPATAYSPYFFLFAGSGGLSTVSQKPSWQTGVEGITAANSRSLPDISMFASSGYAWGHTLLLCDSFFLPSGTTCDFSNPNNVYASSGGGTSFVAPAFAGIMALISQKNGRQGQANYVLYPLAAQQSINSTSTTEPNLANCAAYLGAAALPSCYFHDISSTPNPDPATQGQTPFLTGTNAVPCTGSASVAGTFTDASVNPASNSEDCYGYEITVTQNGSSLAVVPDYYGILSTADNAASPAFSAAPGYDLATGLGSPNVAALVNAPEWSTLAISSSALPQGTVGVAYSQTLAASGRIPPYRWSVASGSLPPGLSLAAVTGIISGTPTTTGLSTFAIQVVDSESTPASAMASFSLAIAAPPPIVNPGFTASANPTSLTIPFAGSGIVTFTLTPQGGFTGPVSFSCGELPENFSCSFAMPSVAFTASGGPITNTLTIHAAASTAAAALLGGVAGRILAAAALWMPLSLGLLVRGRRRSTPLARIWMIVLLCAGFAGIGTLSGCGQPDHQALAGAYSVPVNLTSPGAASQTVNVVVHLALI